jgi:lysozyme
MWAPEKLRDFFVNFDKTNPNHLEAVDILQRHAAPLMNDDSSWVKVFRKEDIERKTPDKAVELITKWEGFSSSPYLCPAGVWTIGYGSTYYPDGNIVTPEDKAITREEALEILKNHIEKAIEPILAKTIPTWHNMNENKRAAIISFAYNVGSYFYGGTNFFTITNALSRKENWDEVPRALRLYVNPGSSFEQGLRNRRNDEVALWLTAPRV